MNNIWMIFKRDLRKIATNSMAIILAAGVLVLPSLYAWVNIYANWDPYGKQSTGNMKIAVMIEDKGISFRDIDINIGDQIEENLKANDVIDWQFLSKEEGVRGVKAGDYYANRWPASSPTILSRRRSPITPTKRKTPLPRRSPTRWCRPCRAK